MPEEFGEIRVLGIADKYDQLEDGVAILVDKPKGWSSFKVVRLLRSKSGIKKVGHAGTLDPMATGLLICCIGRKATRRVGEFMGLEKEYTGVMRLGETTASLDAEEEVDTRTPADHITEGDLRRTFLEFVGQIEQIPPMYSAIQVGGRRLYELARRGHTIEREPRRVHVETFELVALEAGDASFRVVCSKGTYIRSLARDVGQALGVGAHLVALRRVRIGPFRVEDAISTDLIAAA